MAVAADLFGTAYLDAESFRDHADLFGVGMPLSAYPADTDGEAALKRVLQAASRAIDAYCGKTFTPGDRTETHPLDLDTWQFVVNNPPVASISSCVIRYAVDGTLTINVARLYINNQKNYVEISRDLDGSLLIMEAIGRTLGSPQVEVVYKSAQSVPNEVKLATGYQAAHMMNSGFVDKVLPPNFGKLDVGGLEINNRRGARSEEEHNISSISADAVRLLQSHKRFVAA